MYFKKLTMHGFKSFADPISIEFDRGITCVVGPNGSGKSNISDALRWVLGEQSPKMLRGGKMDEVIFAGTDTRKSRGMAEVTLVIDNSDNSLPIDFNEVSITRRMYRSGESEYFINDTQCRLRDIRELIMDTGIGVDGYSIIGQGKISDIINGKADSRREIFEEAAGIVKYRSRKAEAERKLEATTINLSRVNDIVKELENRLHELKEASKKARKYLELNDEYKKTEINVTLKNIEQTNAENTILQNDSIDLENRIAEIDAQFEAIDSEMRKRKVRMDQLDDEDFAERDRLMSFNAGINELKNSVRLNTERINSLNHSCNIFNNEKLNLNDKLNRELMNKKELEKQLEELIKKANIINSELMSVSGHLEKEKAEFEEKSLKFNEDRDLLYELSMEASSKAAELDGLKRINESLTARKVQLDEEDIEVDAEAAALYKESLKIQSALTEQKDRAEMRASGLRQKIEFLEEKEKRLSDELELHKMRMNEEQTRKNMLQQLEDSYEGYNSAVKFIMKDSGVLGTYGTVGDLVRVPRGYEMAIETALGSRMQNIVCKNDESAGAAIRVLKARRLGRLTFLPVESIIAHQRRDLGELAQEEGFLGIAADKVTYDNIYGNIIEYLLNGIVIVKTLSDAIEISKKYRGFRYVTIEGELVNPSGAITGGAHRANNTNIFERRNRINESDKFIFQIENQSKQAEAEYLRVCDERETVRNMLAEAEEESRKLEIEFLHVKNKSDALALKMTEYDSKVARKRRETDRLYDELKENERLISEVEKAKGIVDARVENIKQIAETMSEENELSRRSIDEMEKRRTSVQIEFEALSSKITNTEELITNTGRHINEINDDIAAKERAVENTEVEQKALEAQIKKITEEIRLKEQTQNEHSDALKKIRDEKENLNRQDERDMGTKLELDKKRQLLSKSRYDISLKLEGGNVKIEGWKDRLWDEFEISYLQALEYKWVSFDLSSGIKESKRIRNEIKDLGEVNMAAITEFETVSERYRFLAGQRRDLIEAIDSLKKIISDTDEKIRDNFSNSFDVINENFREIFAQLFGGGKAQVVIDPDEDMLSANIDIIVQPPGKRLQNMNLLSGGEKTMTAIALMFAVLKAKPTPFCILDEVEAALDEANIVKFAEYLKNFEGIQFVLVTHQKATMEHANVLYGVTMPEKGISNVLSLKLTDAEKMDGIN
ncbi:MAG: chromosome segregation protein SMC [Firmicutes bacterium]|nr:chromosome segregation protein SMC [Bacillota bacterium]